MEKDNDGFEVKEKKIDSSWKDKVEKEKNSKEDASDESAELPESINFSTFISGLYLEGLIALGKIEHPISKEKKESPHQAKYVIDTLMMLKDKTQNNLTLEEVNGLDQIIYELQTAFVGSSE